MRLKYISIYRLTKSINQDATYLSIQMTIYIYIYSLKKYIIQGTKILLLISFFFQIYDLNDNNGLNFLVLN